VNEAKPGSIILAHDIHPPTIEAMPETFDELQAKGFKFVTVTELLAMARPIPPKPAAASNAPTPIPLTSPAAAPSASAPSTTKR
jgi:hypothetical protein